MATRSSMDKNFWIYRGDLSRFTTFSRRLVGSGLDYGLRFYGLRLRVTMTVHCRTARCDIRAHEADKPGIATPSVCRIRKVLSANTTAVPISAATWVSRLLAK